MHEHAHQPDGQQHDGDDDGCRHQDGRGEVGIDHEEQEAGHQGQGEVGEFDKLLWQHSLTISGLEHQTRQSDAVVTEECAEL